jgi:aspartyl-tRNA(Asn)/glutamyl-tRNA(Gln) amidotransferase subunit C
MKNAQLSTDEVKHLAKLANLSVNEEEIKKYQGQFNETLDYVENLKELNTDNISDEAYVFDTVNVNFEDGKENKRNLSIKEVLQNSKSTKGNFFNVKRIM